LVITAGAAAAAHFLVPESLEKNAGRINWLAAVLLSGWLVALLLGVSQAPTWGWGSVKVISLIVVAVVLGVAWVVVETRSPNPLIDMKMMRIRAVWATNLVALLFGVGMYALFAFLPEFVQTPSSAGYGFGASITESGLMLLPLTVTMFVLGMVTGRLGEKFGSKNVLILGSIVSFGSFLFLALAHDQKWEIYVSMALMGVGFGMAFSAMPNLIVAAVPPEQTGVASGMNANIRTIGGSLGAAFMASIVAAGVSQGATPKESGYTNGYYMLGGAMALSALAAVLIPAARRDPATHHEAAAELRHAELAIVAGGTVVGDESE
jgi:MFS family permease